MGGKRKAATEVARQASRLVIKKAVLVSLQLMNMTLRDALTPGCILVVACCKQTYCLRALQLRDYFIERDPEGLKKEGRASLDVPLDMHLS